VTPELRGVVLALLLSVIGVAADAVLKMASLTSKPFASRWFWLGCVLSCCFAVVFTLLLQTMRLSTAGLVYAVTSVLMLIMVGALFFDERLTPSEMTGVAMAMGALVLLGRAGSA
jgi:multidrug transporter EmrE-like cation transporter